MANNGDRAGKFWFSPEIPEEVKNSCRHILIENEFLVPNWCNEVRIYWSPDGYDKDGDTVAYITSNYAYRFAAISICPPFLNEEEEDRKSKIKHELCHIVSTPLASYVKDTANILTDEHEIISQIVNREITERAEAMTEDLVYVLMKMEEFYIKKYSKK